MSTVYYLRNKKDHEEHENYLKFLEGLKADINTKIREYSESVNGKYINSDFPEDAEDIITQMMYKLEWEMGYEEQELGTSTRSGFSWYSCSNGLEEIKKNYDPENNIIVDEYGKEFSLEEFVRIAKN